MLSAAAAVSSARVVHSKRQVLKCCRACPQCRKLLALGYSSYCKATHASSAAGTSVHLLHHGAKYTCYWKLVFLQSQYERSTFLVVLQVQPRSSSFWTLLKYLEARTLSSGIRAIRCPFRSAYCSHEPSFKFLSHFPSFTHQAHWFHSFGPFHSSRLPENLHNLGSGATKSSLFPVKPSQTTNFFGLYDLKNGARHLFYPTFGLF